MCNLDIYCYYFVVNQVAQPVNKFDDLKKNNPDAFKPYHPSKDCGKFGNVVMGVVCGGVRQHVIPNASHNTPAFFLVF